MCEVDHDRRIFDGQLHSLSIGCVAALDQHASIVEDSGQVADHLATTGDDDIRHAPLHQMCADETGAAEDGDVDVGGKPLPLEYNRAWRRGRKRASLIISQAATSMAPNRPSSEPFVRQSRAAWKALMLPRILRRRLLRAFRCSVEAAQIIVLPAVTQEAETGAAADATRPPHRASGCAWEKQRLAIISATITPSSQTAVICQNGNDCPTAKPRVAARLGRKARCRAWRNFSAIRGHFEGEPAMTWASLWAGNSCDLR